MSYRKADISLKLGCAFLFIALVFVGAASAQKRTVIWSLQDSDSSTTFTSIAFSPNGEFAAYGRVDSSDVKILNAANGTLIRTLYGRNNNARALAFSPDNQYLATGTGAGGSTLDLNLWHFSDGVRVAGRIAAHNNGTYGVSFSPDSQLLVTCGKFDRAIKLWHVPDMSLLNTISNDDPNSPGIALRVNDCAFSPDGQLIASSDGRGIKLRRASDGALIRIIGDPAIDVTSLAYSPNGAYVAGAVESDRTVKLWRVSDGELLRSFTADGAFDAPHIAFSPDGNIIAAGFGDDGNTGTIEFWRVVNGEVALLAHKSSFVQSFAFAPKGGSYGYTLGNGRVEVAYNPIQFAATRQN